MTMLISTFPKTLRIALNASKTTKFGFPLKNWAINMCIVPVLLELRKSLFLAHSVRHCITFCSDNTITGESFNMHKKDPMIIAGDEIINGKLIKRTLSGKSSSEK